MVPLFAYTVYLLDQRTRVETPSVLAVVLTTALTTASALTVLILMRRLIHGLKRRDGSTRIDIAVGGISLNISRPQAERASVRRRLPGGTAREAKFWREPVLKEILNLSRYGFAPRSLDRDLTGALWEPPEWSARAFGGVSKRDIDALWAAREMRRFDPGVVRDEEVQAIL